MGRLQDQITIASLAAQSTNFTGSAINLSGYTSGALWINTTVAGTTMTPAFQVSFDGTNYLALPTSVLATPAAITATGLTAYPFLVPIALPSLFRLVATAFTGAFTAVCYATLNHP